MQDRPTAPELLEAVRTFLTDRIEPRLEGRDRFHLRVARNVLAILEREWLHEDAALRAEHELLASLLDSDTQTPGPAHELRRRVRDLQRRVADAIRSGALDGSYAETHTALYAIAVDKLKIANPRWLEEPEPGQPD